MRLYANEKHYSCTTESLLKILQFLKEQYEEMDRDSWRLLYKSVCDKVRNDLGIKNIISFCVVEEGAKALILVYEVEATTDNFYTHKFDEEKQMFYIEI